MFENIIQKIASNYEINSLWVKAIISQESSWKPYALRYEANYNYLFHVEHFAKSLNLSVPTETMTQKMSWGLGQIMGALAREQGHQDDMGELFLPEINITHICIRLKALKKISALEDDVFAMYNFGPGGRKKVNEKYPNQAYVDGVKRYLQTYLKA